MTAYREQYAKVRAKGGAVLAISTDDVATLKRFKESLGAPFIFLADPDGKVAAQYGGVMAEGYANRATFVATPAGTIGHSEEGMAALNPASAVAACRRPGAPTTI